MKAPIQGIHHVTAIAGVPQRNLDFYAKTLGLRLLKVTVNFDDPGTYHFYFGDSQGTPGTILTFFPYAAGRQGVHGDGEAVRVSIGIPRGALDYWRDRLGSMVTPLCEKLRFSDPDGMAIAMVEIDERASSPWTGTDVPPEYQIVRVIGLELAESNLERTGTFLESEMGWKPVSDVPMAFSSGVDSIELAPPKSEDRARIAVGSIHHVAFRLPDDAAQLDWRTHLANEGFHVSPVMDRDYFHSIYFREPGGVLFELATDPPGFTVDEPLNALGTSLKLPKWLEAQRSRIEAVLPPVKLPHEY